MVKKPYKVFRTGQRLIYKYNPAYHAPEWQNRLHYRDGWSCVITDDGDKGWSLNQLPCRVYFISFESSTAGITHFAVADVELELPKKVSSTAIIRFNQGLGI